VCKCTARLRASNAIAAVLTLVSRLRRVAGWAGMSQKAILAFARAPVSALAIRFFHLEGARRTRPAGRSMRHRRSSSRSMRRSSSRSMRRRRRRSSATLGHTHTHTRVYTHTITHTRITLFVCLFLSPCLHIYAEEGVQGYIRQKAFAGRSS
jgi:hypothetical protein